MNTLRQNHSLCIQVLKLYTLERTKIHSYIPFKIKLVDIRIYTNAFRYLKSQPTISENKKVIEYKQKK